MRRRDFIQGIAGSVATWPLCANAQQDGGPRVGFVHNANQDYVDRMAVAFREGLKQTGYVEGQNLSVVYRWADGHNERLNGLISDLLSQRIVALLAAGSNEPARVAKAMTTTIPIVFVSATDPVSQGIVASLNHPGGNVTGISVMGSALEAKRLELLHQVAPTASTIAALIDPHYSAAKTQTQEAQEAADHLGLKLILLSVTTENEIEPAFAALAQQGAGAALITQGPLFVSQRALLATLAARYKLPAIYPQREYADAGGLMSYGTDFPNAYYQAGIYVGKILKGQRPADLPVMQPTKFELVINLKTAQALDLTVPPSLLATADEVIE
jgi:putative tryptophan/tyrosine transport system substrate-binding protein